jgi:hypothetical protein
MSMALFIAVGSVDSQRLVDSAGELLKPWQRAEEVGAARQGYLNHHICWCYPLAIENGPFTY